MDLEKSCAFTGHRQKSLPWGYNENDPACIRLKARLRDGVLDLITGSGVRHFISGMAQGVDTYAAELIIALRESGFPVTLECALPCGGQESRWTEAAQQRYRSLLSRCDILTQLQEKYTPGCMQARNRYMVAHSRFVLAVRAARSALHSVLTARLSGLTRSDRKIQKNSAIFGCFLPKKRA